MLRSRYLVHLAVIAATSTAFSQSPQENGLRNGSIGGVVRLTPTDTPASGILVHVVGGYDFEFTDTGYGQVPASPKTAESTTNAQGSYRLANLPPGTYRVYARRELHGEPLASKIIKVIDGQDVSGITLVQNRVLQSEIE